MTASLLYWLGLSLAIRTAPPCPVGSCTCDMPRTAAEALQRHEAVFTAVAVAVRDTSEDTSVSESEHVLRIFQVADLYVTHVWKGQPPQSLSMRGGESCLIQFEAGREYLIYANTREGSLGTSWCDRSRLVEEADADLKVLGSPRMPGE